MLFAFSNNIKAQNSNQNNTKMENINQLDALHDISKSLSVKVLFEGKEGVTRSLQINKVLLIGTFVDCNEKRGVFSNDCSRHGK